MRKKMKIWLWAATCLVLIGCIIFGGVMTVLKWDFKRLLTVKYETNQHEIEEDYQNITIITNTADITFAVSEDGKHRVTCHEQENAIHSVSIKDAALVIELVDTRKWHEYLGIGFDSPNITVYLPQGAYGKLSIQASTGDIHMPKDLFFESADISVSTGDITLLSSVLETANVKTTTGKITVANVNCMGNLSVKVSTGKAKISNVTCRNLTSFGTTGDVSLENVIAKESLSIERSTGDIELDRCDAQLIHLKTDTGDVEGTLLSEKVFSAETKTGDVDVPQTTTGGKCEIHTNTGDIKIKILH
ncbi:MAG: DUF4097 family beta strand repeat protein [Oscillospiraceae bacterium]|nr:DUF4097 family beta strand repeat protein [Oscillospiraceae bacterium]